jgi:hypothetical protein
MVYGKKSYLKNILRETPLFLLDKNKMILSFGKKISSFRDIFYKHCKVLFGNGMKMSF